MHCRCRIEIRQTLPAWMLSLLQQAEPEHTRGHNNCRGHTRGPVCQSPRPREARESPKLYDIPLKPIDCMDRERPASCQANQPKNIQEQRRHNHTCAVRADGLPCQCLQSTVHLGIVTCFVHHSRYATLQVLQLESTLENGEVKQVELPLEKAALLQGAVMQLFGCKRNAA